MRRKESKFRREEGIKRIKGEREANRIIFRRRRVNKTIKDQKLSIRHLIINKNLRVLRINNSRKQNKFPSIRNEFLRAMAISRRLVIEQISDQYDRKSFFRHERRTRGNDAHRPFPSLHAKLVFPAFLEPVRCSICSSFCPSSSSSSSSSFFGK